MTIIVAITIMPARMPATIGPVDGIRRCPMPSEFVDVSLLLAKTLEVVGAPESEGS